MISNLNFKSSTDNILNELYNILLENLYKQIYKPNSNHIVNLNNDDYNKISKQIENKINTLEKDLEIIKDKYSKMEFEFPFKMNIKFNIEQ